MLIAKHIKENEGIYKKRKVLDDRADEKAWSECMGIGSKLYIFKGKAGLYEKALKSGLLIRDCSNYEGLTEGHYRIAIRSEEENERLITWLEKL